MLPEDPPTHGQLAVQERSDSKRGACMRSCRWLTVVLLACLQAAHPWQGWTQAGGRSAKAVFVGSDKCERCHAEIYTAWKKTRMANVIRDPKAHPEAVLGDFTSADPVRTFTLDDVAFVYGSRYKQRYFTRRGEDYFPLPANGILPRKSGCLTTLRPGPTGGRSCMGPATSIVRQDRPAMVATQ
jgi:hypothetical protein